METIKKLQLRVKNEYPEGKALGPLKVAEKRVVLFELERSLKKMTSKENYAVTGEITEICLTLLQSEAGHSLCFQIATLFRQYRLDPQPLLAQIVQITQKPQLSEVLRNQHIKMIGQVFAEVNTLIQPPAKEIIELLLKLQKQRPPEFKALSFDTIAKVLQSGHVLNQQDILLKTILKSNNGEFQHEWLDCVSAIVEDYPSTYVQWQNVWAELMQVAIKEMEMRCTHQVMGALMRARLRESKQQGNIKSSFKQFNLTLKGDGKKKATTHVLDVPRSLFDIISFFSAMVQKLQAGDATKAQQNIVGSIFKLLSQLFKQSPEHLETVPVEHLFGCLLLTIPDQPQNQLVTKVCVDVLDTLESCDSFTEEVFKFILQVLKEKKILLKNETLQDLQTYTQKVQKSELSIGQGAQICLLRTLNELIQKLDIDRMAALTNSCNTFVDIILPYFQSHDTAIFACEVIQATGRRNPCWLHQLTSVMLSQVQIQCADMMSQPPTTPKAGTKLQSVQHNILSMLSLALSCLLQSFPQVIGGEPISLVGIAFQTARGFIMGKQAYRDISEFSPKHHNYRSHGFTILEGLIGLGERWVSQNQEELMNLLASTFNKQMCQVEFNRLSEEAQYLEFYIQEYGTKTQALKCVLRLLRNEQLGRLMVKKIGSFIGNATMYLTYKDSKLLWNAMSWQEVTLAHSKLFDCLSQVSSSYYKSKLVGLLHTICDTIVNENVEVFLLDAEDNFLTQLPASTENPEVTQIQNQVDLLARNQSLLRKPFDMQVEKRAAVEHAIKLFAQIFTSGNITLTNQEQLIKHFLAHTQPSIKKGQQEQILKYRPEKILKMKRIGATFIQVLKITPGIISFQQVNQLVENLLQTEDESFARICGELQFENNAQQILNNGPDSALDQIEESLSQNLHANKSIHLAIAASVCGLIVRNFEDSLWTPTIARVTNIFLKLLQSQNTTVTKFSIHYAMFIARYSASFGQQVLPSIFTKYYSGKIEENIEAIRKSIVWFQPTSDQTIKEILLADTVQHRDAQYALIENGQFDIVSPDLVLGEIDLTHKMIAAAQFKRLDGDGKLIYHLLDKVAENQLENSELLQLSQEAYISVARAHLQEHGIKTHLEFVKQCLAYTHLSPLTLMTETSSKNEFGRALRSDTLSFVVESLIQNISSQRLSTADLVQLLTFGMSVSSNSSKRMKLAGIGLVKVVVKLLAQTVEQVGDIDEDLSPEAREMQIYLASPLLLEQFEAQIFSIIRQVLTSKGVDYQPEVVKSVLDLVLDFVTLPITKDASLVKRIVEMLTNDFQLFNGEMFTHEGLITEMHYWKLSCLAKLYQTSVGKIERRGDLPSKYEAEDQDNLARAFKIGQVLDLLKKHWQSAIQDLVNIQSDNYLPSFKKNSFIIGGSFDISELKDKAQAIVEALLSTSKSEATTTTVHSYVVGCLSSEFSGELFDFYQQKITALSQLLQFVDRLTPQQLSELQPLMHELASLGISEITQLVVKVDALIVQSQVLEAPNILKQVTGILTQADSDLQDQSLMMYQQIETNDRNVIRACLECVERCIDGMVQQKMEDELENFVSQTLSAIFSKISSSKMKNQDIYTTSFIQLLTKLQKTDIPYFSVQAVSDLARMIEDTSLSTPSSQLLFVHLLVLARGPEVSDLVQNLPQKTFEQLMPHLQSNQLQIELAKVVLLKTLELCHSSITASRLGLPLVFQIYSKLENKDQRARVLVPYFALLMQVMQSKQQVDDVTRTLAAEHLAMLVRVDLAAFQQFALAKDGKGQLMLSGVEKTVTENVIRQYASQQMK